MATRIKGFNANAITKIRVKREHVAYKEGRMDGRVGGGTATVVYPVISKWEVLFTINSSNVQETSCVIRSSHKRYVYGARTTSRGGDRTFGSNASSVSPSLGILNIRTLQFSEHQL